jgi:hypothetical protein
MDDIDIAMAELEEMARCDDCGIDLASGACVCPLLPSPKLSTRTRVIVLQVRPNERTYSATGPFAAGGDYSHQSNVRSWPCCCLAAPQRAEQADEAGRVERAPASARARRLHRLALRGSG